MERVSIKTIQRMTEHFYVFASPRTLVQTVHPVVTIKHFYKNKIQEKVKLVYFQGNNLPFIWKLYIDYGCPEKFNGGYEYVKLTENVNANVQFLDESVGEKASNCRDKCDRKTTCDFFMYSYRRKRCIMWYFVRPSRVLQVGLTLDAIFCIKQGKYT